MKTKHTQSMKTKPKETQKAITRHHSSPLPSCFQPHAPPQPTTTTTTTTNPNLTTSLYQTHLGLFSLSWSRSFLSRALHLTLHPTPLHSLSPSPSPVSTNSPVFHLSLKPFIFWNKQGIKQLTFPPHSLSSDPTSIWVFWDFTSAKFGPRPEPERGYYIAVLHLGEMTLLVGDQDKQAYDKTKALKPKKIKSLPSPSPLVLRREHVVGKNRFYTTRMELGERMRSISIELNEKCDDGPRLLIKFDQKRVIMVKHLSWKFRGSERIEFDGHPIQLSWDVYNWLFDGEESGGGGGNKGDDGYALFTFRFEGEGTNLEDEDGRMRERGVQQHHQQQEWSQESCGLNYERKKMKKRLMVKNRSPNSSLSSSSLSSVSSCCSSVLDWESVEENELKGPTGFSLLVYAWKK